VTRESYSGSFVGKGCVDLRACIEWRRRAHASASAASNVVLLEHSRRGLALTNSEPVTARLPTSTHTTRWIQIRMEAEGYCRYKKRAYVDHCSTTYFANVRMRLHKIGTLFGFCHSCSLERMTGSHEALDRWRRRAPIVVSQHPDM
jgi:hypothetical protein